MVLSYFAWSSSFCSLFEKRECQKLLLFERYAFKMNKIKERQFLVGVRGQSPCNKNHAKSQRAQKM